MNLFNSIPGPTSFSMSCSDKLSKWVALGLQGGLISNFVDKIRIDTINLGPAQADLEYLIKSIKRLDENSDVSVKLVQNTNFTRSPTYAKRQSKKIVPESSSRQSFNSWFSR